MNKTELIAKIAEGAGLSKVDAKKALDAAVEATVAALKAGDKVQIPGIITLAVEKRAARKAAAPKKKDEAPKIENVAASTTLGDLDVLANLKAQMEKSE